MSNQTSSTGGSIIAGSSLVTVNSYPVPWLAALAQLDPRNFTHPARNVGTNKGLSTVKDSPIVIFEAVQSEPRRTCPGSPIRYQEPG